MTRKNLGLVLGGFGELTFKGCGDAGVERPSRLTQQHAIGSVLYKGMIEQIARMRWYALPEQQTRLNEAIERQLKLGIGFAYHQGKQCMGKFTSDRRADLRDLFGATESVEPRHQRRM